MKDPIALLSAEWLAATFDMDVMVLIRHPAAFVSSLLKLNWRHPFDHFTRQPLLMRDLMHPFTDEIERAEAGIGDGLDHGALLWKLLHHVILGYRKHHSTWLFHRHEDLSLNPIHEFEQLFLALDLPFGDRPRRVIQKHTGTGNPSDPLDPGSMRRNSARNTLNWQRRLTPSQVERIRTAVEDVSCHFYTDSDWEVKH